MHAPLEKELIIKEINTGDEELDSCLFSLGCYIGEPITIISRRINGCVVAVNYPIPKGRGLHLSGGTNIN